jgi:hypothetical protein
MRRRRSDARGIGKPLGQAHVQSLTLTSSNVSLGCRVQRGPDWTEDNQDGGEGGLGTVVAFTKADGTSVPVQEVSTVKKGMHLVPALHAVVKWDYGRRFYYPIGHEERFSLAMNLNRKQREANVHRHASRAELGAASFLSTIMLSNHEITSLKTGMRLLKFGRRGKPATRFFRMSADLTKLHWISQKKTTHNSQIFLYTALRVQAGQHTTVFNRFKDRYKPLDHLSFSLIYGPNRSIDICCPDQASFDLWFKGLQELIAKGKLRQATQSLIDPEMYYMKEEYERADLDGDGCLDEAEIFGLLKHLNYDKSQAYMRLIFRTADVDGNKKIDFEEFKVMLTALRHREDIDILWNVVTPNEMATREEFHRFLVSAHGQRELDVTLDEAGRILRRFEPESKGENMRKRSFARYIASGLNESVICPSKEKLAADMHMPMSHYYVNSSHNTYLEGDQLRGNSSANRYIEDLQRGCRCVELDVWDGPVGEPIIFHGHTLTTKISNQCVLDAIKEHAFVASPYPVILSVENHLSEDQQGVMAKQMVETFGSLLHIPSEEDFIRFLRDGHLPSPHDMRNKILIKCKTFLPSHINAVKTGQSVVDHTIHTFDDESSDEEVGGGHSEEVAQFRAKKKKDVKIKSLHPDMQRLIFFFSRKRKNLAQKAGQTTEPVEMFSFSEPLICKLMDANPSELIRFNARFLARIYPAGSRVDSSNYNPVPAWCMGSQLVALNHQTHDLEWQLNFGRFDIGRTGYVLKPKYLRAPDTAFCPNTGPFSAPEDFALSVRVISAEQLNKPKGGRDDDVIDPFVTVEVYGVPRDCASFKTRTVHDNGFNPIWDEEFRFPLREPELALIYIKVRTCVTVVVVVVAV